MKNTLGNAAINYCLMNELLRSNIEHVQWKLLFKQKLQNFIYPFSILEKVSNVSDLAAN